MAETSVVEVGMSDYLDCEEASESVTQGSDDMEITILTNATTVREGVSQASEDVEITTNETTVKALAGIESDGLDEMDGTLIVHISPNVNQIVTKFELIQYRRRYFIQLKSRLQWLSAQIAEAIGRIDLNVDFSESNLYSVKPMDKAPDECPYTEFTVIFRELKNYPGQGLEVHLKPGRPNTLEHPNLVGTPSLVPSPKLKK